MTDIFRPGNTALVTGGASGIGRALAQKCLSHDMKVIIADWDDELLDQFKNYLGSQILFKMDVGNLQDWDRLKKKVDKEFDGIPSHTPYPKWN
jgi:short-subunit dehydrogenase involved in D-alanine esterification of teichoic acids